MNKVNNKRKKDSREKIEKIFIELIQTKEINEITVSDICKKANLNRTTFYSNYIDIYDFADNVRDNLLEEVLNLYSEEVKTKTHSYDFLKLFKYIKENQLFFKTYFKLNYDNNFSLLEEATIDNEVLKHYGNKDNIEYHITFFKNGLNAVIKKWLQNDCKESPEEIRDIIINEYKNKSY